MPVIFSSLPGLFQLSKVGLVLLEEDPGPFNTLLSLEWYVPWEMDRGSVLFLKVISHHHLTGRHQVPVILRGWQSSHLLRAATSLEVGM